MFLRPSMYSVLCCSERQHFFCGSLDVRVLATDRGLFNARQSPPFKVMPTRATLQRKRNKK